MQEILFVDDEPALRRLLRINLEYEGFRCAEAQNGDGALQELRAHPLIALVLTDFRMPKIDGLQFLALMSANPEFRKIPSNLLTADRSQNICERAGQVGAIRVLFKPYNLKDLTRVARTFLTDRLAA